MARQLETDPAGYIWSGYIVCEVPANPGALTLAKRTSSWTYRNWWGPYTDRRTAQCQLTKSMNQVHRNNMHYYRKDPSLWTVVVDHGLQRAKLDWVKV